MSSGYLEYVSHLTFHKYVTELLLTNKYCILE